ncbi:MAG TPA: exo-alpha-sialidase [Firmicutes bacterium]|nr:exo-alpha-sialidase [Bacillota bacterium]
MQHIEVYREPGRFAGWPANYGIWSWGDEIVVGFTVGYFAPVKGFHARDSRRPFQTMQARTLDGGLTWQVEPTPCRTPGGRALSADEHMAPGLGLRVGEVLDQPGALLDPPGGIDFTYPDLALMCARSGLEAGARSWFYVSQDRCASWQGPYRLPLFDLPGLAARTNYLVMSSQKCLFFLTATKLDGSEGRPFCLTTEDGGRTFDFVSWIERNPAGMAIMPSAVRLTKTSLLVAVRVHKPAACSIDTYISEDNGETWHYYNRPVADTGRGGNPPAMIRLADGRLCLTYGYRKPPYGIRAKISPDGGASWGEEIILRADGGNHDLGYPCTVQRADGKIVTVYYYNDKPDGERYIAATIWSA